MLCPNCHEELRMSERQGVEIDYCPQCRGVWLDRGELDKIIERSVAPVKQSSKPGYRDDDDDAPRYYEKKKRGKSFIEDLFDF